MTIKILHYLFHTRIQFISGLFLSSLILLSCQTSNKYTSNKYISGFVSNRKDIAPIFNDNRKTPMAITLPEAQEKTIIIYNHGTTNSFKKEDCLAWYNRTPSFIIDLEDSKTLIYYLCSEVTDFDAPTKYIERRSEEIENLVDRFIALGVKSSNIYLTGRSAGAWSILSMEAKTKTKFNAFFGFSPACCNVKAKQKKRNANNVWNVLHKKGIEAFPKLPQKGILFFYKDDPYIDPSEWEIFESYDDVEVYKFDGGYQHDSDIRNYKSKETYKIIKNYIRKQG